MLVDKYDDILKSEMQDALLELEGIQIPNRAFSVYVGGEACKKIEDDFHIPIFGSRNLLKIENREEVKKNYYWYLEKGGLPHPKEITYKVKTSVGITDVVQISSVNLTGSLPITQGIHFITVKATGNRVELSYT